MPDYTARPLSFKIKKALRYTRLYGPRRTLSIIRGQFNMARTYEKLPAISPRRSDSKHVGVIGCGIFGFGVIGYVLTNGHCKGSYPLLHRNTNLASLVYQRY